MAGTARYEVRIRMRGELGPSWTAVFADLALEAQPDGTTLVRGVLPDQSAVHGLLATIRDLGLSLVSIESVAVPASPTKVGS